MKIIWIPNQNLDSKEGLNILKERKYIKEDFEVLLEIKNQLGLRSQI
jgi:hypothetical protein